MSKPLSCASVEGLRPRSGNRPPFPALAAAPDPKSFDRLLCLDAGQRRTWLRAWMDRMGLRNSYQAAPVLCLVRQTVDRMISETCHRKTPITDQTLKIAWLTEILLDR